MIVAYVVGCGDFPCSDVTLLPDPCPLPETEKKRSLDMREKLIYAPLSGLGGVVYDKVGVVNKCVPVMVCGMCRMLCTLNWEEAIP